MATINSTNLTLADHATRTDPNGAIAKVVEVLTQKNPLLQDMVWKQGNLPTGHLITSRKALPSGTWRRFNEGVAATKSRTDQVTETCGMLDGLSKVDCDLAKVNGNEAAFRASEDMAFIQGLSNDLETAFFYSSTKTDAEKIMGLSPRLDSLTTTAPWYGQIVDSQIAASGSDQASMWLVVWGDNTVYGIYPKGMKAGLEQEDMGKQLVLDGSNNQYRAFVTAWSWKCGLCVEDSRYLVRLANIDTSAIAETGSLLIQDMIKMVNQVHDLNSGRPVIYCNRTINTFLQLQTLDGTKNGTLTFENVGGKPVTSFMGIPIRVTDALVNTEAIVT